MPEQGWVQWDGQHWQIVAKGWAVLWYGWPLILVGVTLGWGLVGLVLARTLKLAKEADFKAHIVQLTLERDNAVTAAEARLLVREQIAQQRENDALAKQQEAETALSDARDVQERIAQERTQIDQEIKAIQHRATNAICAAERIKRRTAKQCLTDPVSVP